MSYTTGGHASKVPLVPMPWEQEDPQPTPIDQTVRRLTVPEPSRWREVVSPIPADLPFYTAAQVAAMTSAEPEWIIPGYIALQAITEQDGKVKSAGKTTLTLDAIGAILNRRPWLGQATMYTRVVYITEQQRGPFLAALTRAGLQDRGDDLLILFRRDFAGVPWPQVVAAAVEKANEIGALLIVVDTISKLAGIRSENDAADWTAAMAPLQDAAHDGLAVWINRHSRKGFGEVGETGRGNSAGSGDVDIIFDLRRPEGNQPGTRRVLSSLSRYDQTPEKSVIELTEEGYVLLGAEEAVTLADALRKVLTHLHGLFEQKESATVDELVNELEMTRASIQRALKELEYRKEVTRSGEGKRGSPFRYALQEKLSAHTNGLYGQIETEKLGDPQ